MRIQAHQYAIISVSQQKKSPIKLQTIYLSFPISWAPGQLKMMDASNFFNTAAMQITASLPQLFSPTVLEIAASRSNCSQISQASSAS